MAFRTTQLLERAFAVPRSRIKPRCWSSDQQSHSWGTPIYHNGHCSPEISPVLGLSHLWLLSELQSPGQPLGPEAYWMHFTCSLLPAPLLLPLQQQQAR